MIFNLNKLKSKLKKRPLITILSIPKSLNLTLDNKRPILINLIRKISMLMKLSKSNYTRAWNHLWNSKSKKTNHLTSIEQTVQHLH